MDSQTKADMEAIEALCGKLRRRSTVTNGTLQWGEPTDDEQALIYRVMRPVDFESRRLLFGKPTISRRSVAEVFGVRARADDIEPMTGHAPWRFWRNADG